MKKAIHYLFIILLFTLAGCQKSPESIVKSGTLDFDKSVTLENLFSSYKYFSTEEWKSSKDSQSRKTVTFTAAFDYTKFIGESFIEGGEKISKDSMEKALPKLKSIKATYVAVFYINANDESFSLNREYMKISGKKPDTGKYFEKEMDIPDSKAIKEIYEGKPSSFIMGFLSATLDRPEFKTN